MTLSAVVSDPPRPPLLGPDDPPAVRCLGEDRARPVLIVADHASNRIPASLGTLGLDEEPRGRHIAYDIGIEPVARALADRLGTPLVLGGYSRLVIDPNRPLDDPTSIPVISDGVVIPGNRGLSDDAIAERVDGIFHPYHRAVGAALARAGRFAAAPALVSLHSFTPSLRGFPRPWHAGILWSDDDRMVYPVIDRLAAAGDILVGDNQPYSGQLRYGCTVETHALAHGLPNILIEVRQDLIAAPAGVAEWVDRLADALAPVLDDPGLYQRYRGLQAGPPRGRSMP